MSEGKNKVLLGFKSLFFEDESETVVTTPVASVPQVAVVTQVVTPNGDTNAGANELTPAEIKMAETKVSNWSGYKNLESLKKFSSIQAKLRTKISDPEALLATSFEMAEVAGLDPASIIAEAKESVAKLHINLTEAASALAQELASISSQEEFDRNNLAVQISDLKAQLLDAETKYNTLSEKSDLAKSTIQRQSYITQQVAAIFVEQWTPVTESKKP